MRTATKVAIVGAGLTAARCLARLPVMRRSRGEVRGHRDRRWIGITNSVAKEPLLSAFVGRVMELNGKSKQSSHCR
jgi:hypothetical protein